MVMRSMKKLSQRGFSMIEVLVSLTILLVSVMGIAGLVVRTTQQEMESYQRVQALILLQDMVDRVNANRQVISCYSNGGSGQTYGTGVSSLPDCTEGNAVQQGQAEDDMDTWDQMLKGSAEQASDNTNIGAMIGARGCIDQVNAGQSVYRITVAWQGMGETVTPINACGEGQYGSETKRRTVSAVVRIGDLT